MTMLLETARIRIANQLREAEESLDTALITQANLLATVVTARRDVGDGPSQGHDAILRIHKSQQALLASGADLARVHARMLEIQKEKGFIEECPPNEPMGVVHKTFDAA